MSSPGVPAFVLDSGALIALERATPAMTALLLRVRSGHARLIVPDAVLAQVWRGGSSRQARVAALLGMRRERCERVALETEAAKRVGVRIRDCGHADVVDVHVALVAGEHRAAVITSDRADIVAVDADLQDRIVDI